MEILFCCFFVQFRGGHPNVVRLESIGFHTHCPVAVMEACWGTILDVKNMIFGGNRMEDELISQLTGDIAEGLAFLHRNDVIHGDLKPANVGIVSAQTGFTPKLLDFGHSEPVGTVAVKDSNRR